MAKEMKRSLGLKNKPLIVSNSVFRGKNFVDVRKNFIDDNGELVPTRKGLQLTPDQWLEVIQVLIDDFLKSKSNSVKTSDWKLKMSNHQQLDLHVEFNNRLTDIIVSEAFKQRIDKSSKEEIITSCLHAISNVLVEYDEIEMLDKVCKNIAMRI